MTDDFQFSEEFLKTYEVKGVLAHGLKTVIYEAIQLSLDRPVAIKVLPSEDTATEKMKQRFLREAKCLAKMSHSNIVDLYDYGLDGSSPYIAEELLQGETLASFTKDGKPLPLRQVLSIGKAVASALTCAHEAGVLHRDLKPANVFLVKKDDSQDFIVKLIDFGLAKRPGADATLTERGQIVSSLAFAAPEQIMAAEPTVQTDLYALGTVLYLLLTGNFPFKLDNRSMLHEKVNKEAPPLAEKVTGELPNDIAQLVDELLAREAKDRPKSAAEVHQRLSKIGTGKVVHKSQKNDGLSLSATSVNASLAGSETRVIETNKRRLVPFLAISALVVTLALLVFSHYSTSQHSDDGPLVVKATKTPTKGATKKTPTVKELKLTSVGATSVELTLDANVPVEATLTISSLPKGRYERAIELKGPKHRWQERIGTVPQKKKYSLEVTVKHESKELTKKKLQFSTGSVSTHIVLAGVQFKTEAPLSDFSKLWSEDVFARGSPTLWQGKLFVGLNEYGLFCLDVKGQKQVWRRRDLKGMRGLRLFGKTLYALDKARKLTALSAEDGKDLWSLDLPADVNFAMNDSKAGLLLWKPFVGPFCVDKTKGKYLGKIDDSNFCINSWTVAADGTLWLTRSRQELWAYNSANGKRLPEKKVELAKELSSSILTVKEALYLGLEDGSIIGGKPQEMVEMACKLPGPVRYLAADENNLYAYSDSPPTVVALHMKKNELLWRRKVKDRAVSPLVVFRDRVYFSGEKKCIHCLDDKYGWYLFKHYTGLRRMFGLIPWEHGVVYCSHVGDIIALSDA